ncbi:hypothetical protein HG531_002703 [Fusarium graminearum]|nr:hypothetical protein HG531_002703 [Fusarium graminearum]
MTVDKARLITSQEDNGVSLLNSLAESSHGEVDLTSVSLSLVITKPVLQKRCVERRRAEVVEAEALSGVNHGELTGESEDSTLGGSRKNGVLAAEPHTLDVDVLGEIPDVLGGVDGVVILGVHDTGVVEEDVDAAPRVE